MDNSMIIAILGELVALCGTILPVFAQLKKIRKGTLCQLRSDMLHIYYHNQKTGKIRQYEYENFVFLYEAYKALNGNSFIDKIYKEVQDWEVTT